MILYVLYVQLGACGLPACGRRSLHWDEQPVDIGEGEEAG